MASTGLKRTLIGEIEIKAASGDAFHEFFCSKPHHISTVNPDFIQDCELHDGSYGKVGSKICWRYSEDGKAKSAKQIIEEIDEEKKIIKFNIIEGDLLEEYKSFVVTYEVIPKDEHKCIVKWTFEYEKLNQATPEPSSTMDSLVNLAKEICDHHHSQGATPRRVVF